MGTPTIGYNLICNVIGEKHMEVIVSLASKNARNTLQIPTTFSCKSKLCNILKQELPQSLLSKLIFQFGGQRLYISREHKKIDQALLRKKASNDLTSLGYSIDDVSFLLGVTENTITKRYAVNDRNWSSKL